MTLSKNIISKQLSNDINLTRSDALILLNQFLLLIKTNSNNKKVKISGFGTFQMQNTVKRIGRNPKTKESYIIKPRKKLNFTGSNILKNILNP